MTIRERLIEKRKGYCKELADKTVERISEEFLKIFDRDMTVNSIKRKIGIQKMKTFNVYIIESGVGSIKIMDVNSLDILEDYKEELIQSLRNEGVSCTPVSPEEDYTYTMEMEVKLS